MVENCNSCAHKKGNKCVHSGYYCTVTRSSARMLCNWQEKEPLKLNHIGFLSIGIFVGLIIGYLIF